MKKIVKCVYCNREVLKEFLTRDGERCRCCDPEYHWKKMEDKNDSK